MPAMYLQAAADISKMTWRYLNNCTAFPVATAQIWHTLPEHIVAAPKLQSFRLHLKMFLLQQSFCL